MKTKNKKINKGGTLIEALISIGLISFVIVSILSGFAQQQADTSRNTDYNMAVMLAEMRMEELMKFPADQLVQVSSVDYIVPRANGFEVYVGAANDPGELRQFQREADIDPVDDSTVDPLGQMVEITVKVSYGARKGTGNDMFYPFHVELSSRRSVK